MKKEAAFLRPRYTTPRSGNSLPYYQKLPYALLGGLYCSSGSSLVRTVEEVEGGIGRGRALLGRKQGLL